MDLKAKKLTLIEFAAVTKSVIANMKVAVKCLEDFDVKPSDCEAGSKNHLKENHEHAFD